MQLIRRAIGRAVRRLRRAPVALDLDDALARWWPDWSDGPVLAGTGKEPDAPIAGWEQALDVLERAGALDRACACLLVHGRADLAMALVTRAVARCPDRAPWALACRVAYEAAQLDQAAVWAGELVRAGTPAMAERRLVEAIRERHAVLTRLRRAPCAAPVVAAEPRRVLAMLAYSLPYTSNGYATRSHGLLSAVKASGWDVLPHTRPGFPGDALPAWRGVSVAAGDGIGGLRYERLEQPSRRNHGHMAYLQASADEIVKRIRALRPRLVHAASNYMTALPAAIAARECGLPFVYEVRGFWDVTRMSSDPAFGRTTEYRYLRLFESELLRQADAVVTLTPTMREELVRRGAPADRIEVAPNAVDVMRWQPGHRREETARALGLTPGVPVIGYIGSFVDYEGLDDLVQACGLLDRKGIAFQLLLVGDGLALPAVREAVARERLQDKVILPGRVDHQHVADHYAWIDVCPFPRKPWPVCELVSPLKPFEAMAQGKAVLVSDVAAMADMVQEGVTGRRFAKGDVHHLARCLEQMVIGTAECAAMGLRAREWVAHHRNWAVSGDAVARAYTSAMGEFDRRAVGRR